MENRKRSKITKRKKKGTRKKKVSSGPKVTKTRRGGVTVGKKSGSSVKKTGSRVTKTKRKVARKKVVKKKSNSPSSPTKPKRIKIPRNNKLKKSKIKIPVVQIEGIEKDSVRATTEESIEKMEEIGEVAFAPDYRPLNISIGAETVDNEEPQFCITMTAPTPVSPGRSKMTYDILM